MQYLESIVSILSNLKPELLDKYPIKSIALFGSATRPDFSDESDIDILVDFYRPIGIEFIDLADFLEAKLNRKVDLVSRAGIKPRWFNSIQKDIIYV
jgi:predicted nucleotidyltransferase